MLQWYWSVVSLLHKYLFMLRPSNPICEFHVILHCRTQKDKSNILRKHNYSLLPYHTSLLIIYIMYLIENHPNKHIKTVHLIDCNY